jgi:hypothetical protein
MAGAARAHQSPALLAISSPSMPPANTATFRFTKPVSQQAAEKLNLLKGTAFRPYVTNLESVRL